MARDEKVLPLWDHVTEMAKVLRVWIYTFVGATIVFMVLPADLSFVSDPLSFYKPLVSLVLVSTKERFLPSNVTLIAGSFTAPVEMYVLASVVLGFAVSVPVLAYEIYRFVDPALKPNEREAVYPFVSGFSLLFLLGSLFGYFVLLPAVVSGTLLFYPATGLAPVVSGEDFYGFVFFTVLMTGFSFTMPVFLVLLVKFGILGTSPLTKNRKYLWAGVFIITAIITPDGGPIADFALFVPIILLLEGSIVVAKRYEKHRQPGEWPREEESLRCVFCGGPIDAGGVFCGRCGKARF